MKIPSIQFVILTLFGLSLQGCERDKGPTDQCICTDVYAMVTVVIRDSFGNPVDSLTTKSILPRVGKTIVHNPVDGGILTGRSGTYIVMSDDEAAEISDLARDTVLFSAFRNDSLMVSAIFLVGTDPCHCHISKGSGPDILTFP